MTRQPLNVLPQTTSGKWSVGLIIAMPLLFILGSLFTSSLYASIPAGDSILADLAARPALALTMLAGMAAGVLSFIAGLLAIIRRKDRAVLVFASTAIGTLLLIFLAGEMVLPH